MSVRRGPDGKIINVDEGGADDEQTRRIQRRSTKPGRLSDPEAPTAGRATREEPTTDRVGAPAGGEPKTQIVGRPRGGAEEEAGEARHMDDPVVGWVVVVKGPGRGASVPLGYGMNSIGRAAGERVCLDFGDEQISRSQHAIITYDPRGRKYFVQHGGGKNLTYLGEDQPVLTPVELFGGEEITLGETALRFVPFCGKEFDWQDLPDQ
ncbi:MAG: FHA domain-containing protein [Alphaproteobacteria bacterium]|nr:FHA domain-containing protein [Alphaproteobacteria bacterium]